MASIETSLRLTGMLLIVAAMVAVAINNEASGAQEQNRWDPVRIGDAHNWSFIGGAWSDGEGGLISPPPAPWNTGASAYEGQRTTNEDVLMAFHTGRAYGDFEAEFKFRWDGPHCGAGFIFRAQDAVPAEDDMIPDDKVRSLTAFGVEDTVVINHHIIPDLYFVGMTDNHVASEYHSLSDFGKKRFVE